MKQNSINLVDVPDHVTSVMQDRNIPVQTLTPDFIVKCLKSNSSYTLLTLEDKMNIYNYLVSDGEFSRLHGLELLPINNGTFSVFGNRNQYSQVIICKDEIDLFPGQDEKFVGQDLQDKIYKSILEMAKKGKNMFFIATTVYCVVKMFRVVIDDLMKWYQEHFRSIDQKVCYPCPQTANHPSSPSVIYSSETSDWN